MSEVLKDENVALAVSETQGGEAGKETPSQREREQNAIDAVNSPNHFESRVNTVAVMGKNRAKIVDEVALEKLNERKSEADKL